MPDTAMPPFQPLHIDTQESPQLARRKLVEALKVDLNLLRSAEQHALSNGFLSELQSPPVTLSRSHSRRGSYLFALGMTTGDDIAATFTEEPFRRNSPKYLCCCHQIHCKAGTRYIFIIGLIGIVVNILALIFNTITWKEITILLTIAIVVYTCLFLGMKKENEKFLIPYFVFTGFNILLLLVLLAMSIWALIEPQSPPAQYYTDIVAPTSANATETTNTTTEDDSTAVRVISSGVIVACLVAIAISIWFFFVVFKYFLYLRDMKRARHPQTIVYHGDMKNVKVTELTQ